MIICDEWRAQATPYNGDPNVRTPVLERFAAQSTNFTNAVSGCPVCCPARASMMTGQYPLTNGVFINDVELKPTGPTLAELFGKAGYRTGFIGKWHLYGSPDGNYGRRLAYIPHESGWASNIGKLASATTTTITRCTTKATIPHPTTGPGMMPIHRQTMPAAS